MSVLYSATFILLAFLVNFLKKDLNVLAILLITSYFLGFTDTAAFGMFNLFDLNATCLIIYIFYILANLSFSRLSKSLFAKYLFVIMLLYLVAVLNPVLSGNSSLFYSIKEGKEFIHYLAFFAVYLSVRSKNDIEMAWKYLAILAIYYGFLEVAYVLGLGNLQILHYRYRPDVGLGITKVYPPVFSVIFLSLFYQLWRSVLEGARNYFMIVFFFVATMLAAFRSYILGSFIALATAYVFLFKGKIIQGVKVFRVYGLVILVSLFMFSITFSDSISNRINTVGDRYIWSGVQEVWEQKGGSTEGRHAVNIFRWEYFNKRPLIGYGFIDRNSSLGEKVFRSHKSELMMIDTGYLDVLLKFGAIGAILFYGLFLGLLFSLSRAFIRSHRISADTRLHLASLFCFLVTLLAAQVTHGGLTFSFGIIPLAIALGLMDSELCLPHEREEQNDEGITSYSENELFWRYCKETPYSPEGQRIWMPPSLRCREE